MSGSLAISGIYAITSGDKYYIGSAVNVARRWRTHLSQLNRGVHHSRYLQRAWAKHGAKAFQLALLERVDDRSMLIEREQAWIDRFCPAYNGTKTAGSCAGMKQRPESIEKTASANRGGRRSPETRAKISEKLKGRRLSPEHAVKAANAFRGRRHTDETRARMAESARLLWANRRSAA